jgi:hypothetical protein
MSSRPPHELGRDRRRSPSSRVGQGHERGRSATRHESPSRPCGLVSPRQDRHDRRPPPRELGRDRRRSTSPEARQRTSSPHRGRSATRRDSPSRPGGLMSPSLRNENRRSPHSELSRDESRREDRHAFDLRPPVKRKFQSFNAGHESHDRGHTCSFTLFASPLLLAG